MITPWGRGHIVNKQLTARRSISQVRTENIQRPRDVLYWEHQNGGSKMLSISQKKSWIAKYTSLVLLSAVFILPVSIPTAHAGQSEIQLDIAPNFDWSAASIRKLASNTARIFSGRCEDPCTISIRVMIKGSARRISDKRMQWLKQNLTDEMGKKTNAKVVVQDRLLFV